MGYRRTLYDVMRTLEDPGRELPCVILLLGNLLGCTGFWQFIGLTKNPGDLRLQHFTHDFLTSAFRWISCPRTAAERQRLLEDSRCKCPTPMQHREHLSHSMAYNTVSDGGHSSNTNPVLVAMDVMLDTISASLATQLIPRFSESIKYESERCGRLHYSKSCLMDQRTPPVA
jgi:hypothetical protein